VLAVDAKWQRPPAWPSILGPQENPPPSSKSHG